MNRHLNFRYFKGCSVTRHLNTVTQRKIAFGTLTIIYLLRQPRGRPYHPLRVLGRG
uniref:Uncharacterized protein n=1 Tax=Myoviridae sp. ctAys2 TaxID=2825044 RepID=A0A8S5Q3F2_9CAUD|nr:MAG TPA: hypothetical protein [Myoviridae sp. ctAys2]